MAAFVQQRLAFGERAGQQVRRIGSGFGDAGETPILAGPRCASVHGFSLHANTQVPAHRRDQLERLIQYTARGAVSLERLTQDANGDLVYTFTHPWSDGTTGIRLSPMELVEKLAALVPLPRVHLVRYSGCLAPHSHLRGVLARVGWAARGGRADARRGRQREQSGMGWADAVGGKGRLIFLYSSMTPSVASKLFCSDTISAPPAKPIAARPLSGGFRRASALSRRSQACAKTRSVRSLNTPRASSGSTRNSTSTSKPGVGTQGAKPGRLSVACHARSPSPCSPTWAT